MAVRSPKDKSYLQMDQDETPKKHQAMYVLAFSCFFMAIAIPAGVIWYLIPSTYSTYHDLIGVHNGSLKERIIGL